jgi:hypothetical protein
VIHDIPLAGISPENIRLIEGESQRVEPGLIEPIAEYAGEFAHQRWKGRWDRTRPRNIFDPPASIGKKVCRRRAMGLQSPRLGRLFFSTLYDLREPIVFAPRAEQRILDGYLRRGW